MLCPKLKVCVCIVNNKYQRTEQTTYIYIYIDNTLSPFSMNRIEYV